MSTVEAPRSTVELQLPARAEYVGLARLVVSSLAASRRELDDERLDDLRLAVSEAVTLMVDADDAPGRHVMLRCEDDADGFTIEVHDGRSSTVVPPDTGSGMPDPAHLDEDDTLPLELMRALVDDVALVKDAGREVIRLRLLGPPAA